VSEYTVSVPVPIQGIRFHPLPVDEIGYDDIAEDLPFFFLALYIRMLGNFRVDVGFYVGTFVCINIKASRKKFVGRSVGFVFFHPGSFHP
jgi:hypothetical protein